jgi:hypothetical protein
MHRISRSAILVVILLVGSLLPTLVVSIPAMADYPNHLARMHILTAAGTLAENPFYTVRWSAYPNLAMDMIVPWLARVMSVEAATKLFLLLSQLLIVSGAVAFEWTVKKRHQFSGFAALLVLYSLPFAMGFLNFEFTLGLALWALAATRWFDGRRWPVRLAVHTLFVVALFFGHLFALGLYAATLGLMELSKLGRATIPEVATRVMLLGVPVVVVLAAMHISGGAIGHGTAEWELASKLRSVFRSMNGYSAELAAISAAALIMATYILFRSRALTLSPTGRWVAGGLVLLFLAMPYRLFGTAYVDVRVLVAAVLILPAFVFVGPHLSRRSARTAGAMAAAVIVTNAAVTGAVWIAYQSEYKNLKESFRLLGTSARVLIASSGEDQHDLLELPMHHAPTLAVSANAFVPSLYAFSSGLQPIEAVSEVAHLRIDDIRYIAPVPLEVLQKIVAGANELSVPRFVRQWAREFDFVYLVGPRVADPLPGVVQEIAAGHRFVLYRINPTGIAQHCNPAHADQRWEQRRYPASNPN